MAILRVLFFKIKNINLEATWISREKNKEADFLTKVIGHDDWIVNSLTFKSITKNWGDITTDCFETSCHCKYSMKNDVLKYFAILVGKHLCRSFINLVYLAPKCIVHLS